MLKGIRGNVVVLGFVSFFTDVSSDMIYPFLPAFLTALGAGAAFLGWVEGAAQAVAAFFKLYSGAWADRARDRTKLIRAGYLLSSVARPAVAAAAAPWHVFAVRFSDRIGKGLRTPPRDALIADSVDPRDRGKAFGFHRAMDNAGAVAGPALAAFLMASFALDLRTLFWLASAPALVAVILVFVLVREPRAAASAPPPAEAFFRPGPPPAGSRAYLSAMTLFMLGNASDAFLLLLASERGVPLAQLPALWMTLQAVKAASSMPLGALSDRVGRKGLILTGWLLYSAVYAGFAFADTTREIWALFAAYGVFYGLTEGVERAYLADLAPSERRGEAFGWYHFLAGSAALPASVVFGWIWQSGGPRAAFLYGAVLSLGAAALLAFVRAGAVDSRPQAR